MFGKRDAQLAVVFSLMSLMTSCLTWANQPPSADPTIYRNRVTLEGMQEAFYRCLPEQPTAEDRARCTEIIYGEGPQAREEE